MLVISGNRQSGKTESLISAYINDLKESCIIVPTSKQKDLIILRIKKIDKTINPVVFTWFEYTRAIWGLGLNINKIYVDDAIECLIYQANDKMAQLKAVVMNNQL